MRWEKPPGTRRALPEPRRSAGILLDPIPSHRRRSSALSSTLDTTWWGDSQNATAGLSPLYPPGLGVPLLTLGSPQFPRAPQSAPSLVSAPQGSSGIPRAPQITPRLPSSPIIAPGFPSPSPASYQLPRAPQDLPRLPWAPQSSPSLSMAPQVSPVLPRALQITPVLPWAPQGSRGLAWVSLGLPKSPGAPQGSPAFPRAPQSCLSSSVLKSPRDSPVLPMSLQGSLGIPGPSQDSSNHPSSSPAPQGSPQLFWGP